ncbi:AI-2E family transporter [Vibrio hippocampi]|uniref:Transport protein YdiK n=1 Tax=Vibrio hippocampi TaxID=654686 RepID=A0ABN8DQB0_9VIBR|nr:AI-2E family transporter [Vibrio hippocampi]CAH0529855.1 Putative transport protein YdiK [Vibrio hippocampi]
MKNDAQFSRNAIDAFIKIAAISILAMWCFAILRPFILLIVWAGIIATALYPVVTWLNRKFSLSTSKGSGLIALVGVLLLLIPLILLSTGIYSSTTDVFAQYQQGTLTIPKPNTSVQEWPLIGEKAYAAFSLAASNLELAMSKYSEEIKAIAGKLASLLGSLGGGFVQFIISTIIAGVFMSNAEKCEKGFEMVATRLAGDRGKELTQLCKTTVRSVVQGVIGVAVIQSVAAAIGLMVAGVPAAGLWAFAVLLMAIVQLPPILALLPAIIYLFSVDTTTTAVLFLIWSLVVSGSDAFLKPILLSRGSDIPMLVILLGALGGMAMSGIVGLFVGAVILGLSYKLLVAWLEAVNTQVKE